MTAGVRHLNTPAGAHQLCHAHLVRNLQYAIDKERSQWAYLVQRLLLKSKPGTRWHLASWGPSFEKASCHPVISEGVRPVACHAFEQEGGTQGAFAARSAHQGWIFTFMSYPTVPADNNSSERAGPGSKAAADKVSGGFRSDAGASRFAGLLTLTQTLRKQHLPMLASLSAVFMGQDLPLFSPSG
jgi:transposase